MNSGGATCNGFELNRSAYWSPALLDGEDIELAAFASVLGRPLALDPQERAAALGTATTDQAARMATLAAADFTLPDLAGKLHSLSDHLGKKVLLIAYASW